MPDPTSTPAGAGRPPAPDPRALLRSPSYVVLLVLGAVVGAPIAAIAYFFLEAVGRTQRYLYESLPGDLGFDSAPWWWPLPLLVVGGLIVALAIQRLPGTGGHKPAEGFKAGTTRPIELPGIAIAAFATLCCGAVLGPEAPLIAIGSGLGVLAVHLVKKDAPEMAVHRDRRRGQLRGDQHAARIAARGRLPADGGIRPRRPHARCRARPRHARGGRRRSHLRRPRQLDGVRHVLARRTGHPGVRDAHPGRVPVGDRHRHRGGRARNDHPAPRTRGAADRRAALAARHADRRPPRRSAGHPLRPGDRQGHLAGALLGPGRARAPDPERHDLGRRGARAARRLQGPRVLASRSAASAAARSSRACSSAPSWGWRSRTFPACR